MILSDLIDCRMLLSVGVVMSPDDGTVMCNKCIIVKCELCDVVLQNL